jgi:hypothetical protein
VCRGDLSAEQIARTRVPFGVLGDRRRVDPAVFPFGSAPRLRFLRPSRTRYRFTSAFNGLCGLEAPVEMNLYWHYKYPILPVQIQLKMPEIADFFDRRKLGRDQLG